MSEFEPKPINAWPLIGMLVVVVFLFLWINGYFGK